MDELADSVEIGSGCGVRAPAHDGGGRMVEGAVVGSLRAPLDADEPMLEVCSDGEDWHRALRKARAVPFLAET